MLDLFSYPFMQLALVAALCTGLAAPAVGTYLVQRRLALLGDGLGHVAVTGVALGLWWQLSPTWTAVVVVVIGAVVMELIRENGHTNGDVALALLFYGGLSGGVFITGLAGQSGARLNEFLFGAITTLSDSDVWFTIGLTVVVLAITVGLMPQLFAVSQDEEFSRVAGLKVRAYNITVAVLGAVTVAVAMRTVGLLLVSALMVVPVATAQQLTRSFRVTFFSAIALGVGASVGGLLLSAQLSVIANEAGSNAKIASGPTIVLLSLAGFALTWPVGAWLRHRRRAQAPFLGEAPDEHVTAENHEHEHGPGCGHLAIVHGDHIDYVHDGHRHAEHGGHYDEH